MSDRNPTRVQVGSVSLTVSPHTKGFRFGYKADTGRWEYVTRAKKKDAVDAAREKAKEIHNKTAGLLIDHDEALLWQRVKKLKITHSDLDTWEKEHRRESPTVAVALQTMVEEKTTARGEKGIHLAGLEYDLKTLDQDKAVADFTVDDITHWMTQHRERGLSQRRLANLRSSAINLFNWCKQRGWLPDGPTAPQRTIEITFKRGKGRAKKIELYTNEELLTLFKAAPASWHGFIALGAFAGIRTEEMAPRATTKSEGLDWRDVDRARKIIRIPDHVAKTGHGRVIPILPNLEAWLKHTDAPSEGPILPLSLSASRYELHKGGGVTWKKNGLRHSFGTYRTAQTQSLPQVALEMGNSVDMIKRHYYEAVAKNVGEAWFKIMPPKTLAIRTFQNSAENRA